MKRKGAEGFPVRQPLTAAANEERLREFSLEARESLAAQKAVEAADKGTFAEYLARYFAD